MSAPTSEELTRRIAAVLGVAETRVGPDVTLTDLVADSYRLVELAIELQDDFEVIFSQTDLSEVTTVADLAELVRARAR